MKDLAELYETARQTLRPMKLKPYGEAGQVACALETVNGTVFTGICIDLPCSLGFCAEQAAMAEMLKAGETQIAQIIAVGEDGRVFPPCGRCREFMAQISEHNRNTLAAVTGDRAVPLKELLPHLWEQEDV